jgi:hypothetical protein
MNVSARIPLLIVGVLFVISLIILPYLFYQGAAKSLSYQFNGRVDSVSYDAKDEPTVKIHNKKYHLPANYWNFDRQIQVGDSMVKERVSKTIRVFKKDGTVIVKK